MFVTAKFNAWKESNIVDVFIISVSDNSMTFNMYWRDPLHLFQEQIKTTL